MVAIAVAMLAASPACAWGPEGHEIVARIAAEHLSPAARRGVEDLLGAPAGRSMPAVSNWADWIKRDRPETKPWHYVDIELNSAGYIPLLDCVNDDCIVAQIDRDEQLLADPRAPRAMRIEALEFLIHFVGDIHQPLHCADNHDRGGNAVPVEVDGRQTNLHTVWDGDVVATLGADPEVVAARLDRQTSPAQRATWSKGSAADWANESFAIARDNIYGNTLWTTVPWAFNRKALSSGGIVAAVQLEKGGVRLSAILNRVFRARAAP